MNNKLGHYSAFVFLLLSCFNFNLAFADSASEVEWESLMPSDWYPNKVFDDMSDDEYYKLSESQLLALEQQVQDAFDAAPVVDTFEGKRIKIPGFVVPLEYNNTKLTEFLLVPYFGACTHTPPPPANQIIYGKLDIGTDFDDIYLPVWITGTLNIERLQSELNEEGVVNALDVQSAYAMNVESIDPYIE